NTLSVIARADHTVVASVPLGSGARPYGVAVHPAGTFVYVANFGSGTVSVIDTATNSVFATVPVGPSPTAFGQFIGPSTGSTSATSCLGAGSSRLWGHVISRIPRRGVPDVTLTLSGPGGCSDTMSTDAVGSYQFSTLNEGRYTLRPTKD
ncbi:MAG: YncE family protein, partial [Candidatus Entotheonellia bacterium]